MKSNPEKPSRLPSWLTAHQSGFASPTGSRKRRWREMRRSEFVTVPSFSPQAWAGSRTWEPLFNVSLETTFSDTTKSSSFRKAALTSPVCGRLTAGLVPITQSALIAPA